jgi:hypothetical protein
MGYKYTLLFHITKLKVDFIDNDVFHVLQLYLTFPCFVFLY